MSLQDAAKTCYQEDLLLKAAIKREEELKKLAEEGRQRNEAVATYGPVLSWMVKKILRVDVSPAYPSIFIDGLEFRLEWSCYSGERVPGVEDYWRLQYLQRCPKCKVLLNSEGTKIRSLEKLGEELEWEKSYVCKNICKTKVVSHLD